jgi:hypothetical protein
MVGVPAPHEHPGTHAAARLFACACCRCVWPCLGDANQGAVVAAEQVADKRLHVADLAPLRAATGRLPLLSESSHLYLVAWRKSVNPATHAAKPSAWPDAISTADECAAIAAFFAPNGASRFEIWSEARAAEFRDQCRILRDLLGDRFHR